MAFWPIFSNPPPSNHFPIVSPIDSPPILPAMPPTRPPMAVPTPGTTLPIAAPAAAPAIPPAMPPPVAPIFSPAFSFFIPIRFVALSTLPRIGTFFNNLPLPLPIFFNASPNLLGGLLFISVLVVAFGFLGCLGD